MFSCEQLQWIHQNRRPRVSATLLGDAARRLLIGRCDPPGQLADGRLSEAVNAVLSPECRARCGRFSVRKGVVRIFVDDERLVYPYRLQWAQLLLARIRDTCPDLAVREVRFTASGRQTRGGR